MTSCGNDGPPVIDITSPDDMQEFSIGETILFKGGIIDDDGIGPVSYTLLNLGSVESENIARFNSSGSENVVIFDGRLVVTEDCNFEPIIRFLVAASDTDGNSATEEISLIINK